MAMITLVSAAGSPGVTTSAVGLALTWPRPVLLVEADPTGGSAILAGYFRGAVSHDSGLIDLAWAHREGRLADTLPRLTMPIPGTDVSLLPGIRSHGQARGLAGLWAPLAEALLALDGSGQDVIVDGGRLGLTGSPEPLVAAADCTVLTVRSDLVGLSAARSWADSLRDTRLDRSGDGLGVLLVGEGRPYGSREVAKVLRISVTATLAWDPAAAAVFARGAIPPRRFATSALPRSLRAARAALDQLINAEHDAVAASMGGGAR